MTYVTRIAPSPTGMFHMGTARTAYFNWLAAKASGGKFILRIDDTDAARNDAAFTDVIMDAMAWLGLDHDDLFCQSARGDVYAHRIGLLLDSGKAYRDDGAVKLRLPDDLPDVWTDKIKGTIRVHDNDRKMVDGLVLLRSDGTPTYHFASIVDDLSSGVNLIIRGSDHINNTIKQIAIAIALGRTPGDLPEFAHVGLIEVLDPDTGKRKKLSKRDAGASLLDYRDRGYSPDAMLNFLLRLGWSPKDANFDKKHRTIDRDMATAMFLTDGNMRASPAMFDPMVLDGLDRRWKARVPA
jgi:glutamyl-tRNA synthetase